MVLTRSLIEKNGECDRCFLVVYGRLMLFLVIFGLCSRLQFFKGYRNSGGFNFAQIPPVGGTLRWRAPQRSSAQRAAHASRASAGQNVHGVESLTP